MWWFIILPRRQWNQQEQGLLDCSICLFASMYGKQPHTHRSWKCWIKQIWKEWREEEEEEEGERGFKCRWEISFLSQMKDVRTLRITTDVIYHRWLTKSERLLSSFCLLHRGSTQALPKFWPQVFPTAPCWPPNHTDSWGSVQRQVLILSPYLPSPSLRVVPSLLCPKLLSRMRWSYRIHSIRCVLSSLSTQKLLAAQTWCPSISWDGWPLQGTQRSYKDPVHQNLSRRKKEKHTAKFGPHISICSV